MIAAGTYTADEIAELLGIAAGRNDNIKRKLKKLHINYSTSGRGKDTQYAISGELKILNFKQFTTEYLGIKPRFIERLDQFISLLLDDKEYCPIVYGSLAERVKSDDETIKKWIIALDQCGLLERVPFQNEYYATRRTEKEFIDVINSPIYEYYIDIREATKEEYDYSIQVWNNTFNEYMEDYATDKTKVIEEGEWLAYKEKMREMKGWLIMKSEFYYRVNQNWEHLDELKELVGGYTPYKKKHKGNALKDIENEKKKIERIQKLKAERQRMSQKLVFVENCDYEDETDIVDVMQKFYDTNERCLKDIGEANFNRFFLLSLDGFKTSNVLDVKYLVYVYSKGMSENMIHYIDFDLVNHDWKADWLIDFNYKNGVITVKDIAQNIDWQQEQDEAAKILEQQDRKKREYEDELFIQQMEKAAEKQKNNHTIYYESPEIGNGNFTYDGLVKALKDEEKAKEIWNKNVCEYYRK